MDPLGAVGLPGQRGLERVAVGRLACRPRPAPGARPGRRRRRPRAADKVTVQPTARSGWQLRRLDPVAQQVRAGVAGLLRVELGGRQRAVLHRGDERLAVLGPGHQRWLERRRDLQLPAARRVGVHEVEPGVAGRARRTAASRPARRRCSSPCAAARRPRAARPARAHAAGRRSASPCSTPGSNSTCIPTQMPSTGRPPASRSADHVRRRRPRPAPPCRPRRHRRPGTTSPSASSAACEVGGHLDRRHPTALERTLRPSAGCPTRSRARRRRTRCDGAAHSTPLVDGTPARAGRARPPRATPAPAPCTAPR